ncbi:MAG: hypothetical protein RLZZ242_671 [Bacteroidota bacterium]|jgi:hypothetical protein
MSDAIKYPIGTFSRPTTIEARQIDEALDTLTRIPSELKNLVGQWSDAQLDTPYREGGWTARQLIHHLADSHMHSLIRYKWALSEETPLIKAYDQDAWASLPDAFMPIASSLSILEAVHEKIVFIVRSLDQDQLKAAFIHPETKKERNLLENTLLYAWHASHHYAHLERLAEREGW